jgi:type II secretory pathway component PulK
MLVLWATAMLGIAVMGLAQFLEVAMMEEVQRSREFRARQLAESGLAIGLNPLVKPGDPVLNQRFSEDETVEVEIRSEGGRLNINTFAREEQIPVLRALFSKWGLDVDQTSALVDALLDWVDDNDLKRSRGAERRDYAARGQPALPRNRNFTLPEEMRLVMGAEVLDKVKPDWLNYFTVWGEGKLDLNEAPADLIEVVCGVSPSQANAFVQARSGPDKLPGTSDDVRYSDLNAVRIALALGSLQFEQIEERITVNDPVARVVSTGKIRNYSLRMTVVARREQGQAPQILDQ